MYVDVAIVGASSAGLFAAERLAHAGRRVEVIERQPALNHARRTYIITPQIRRVLDPLPAAAILHQTPTIEVCANGASATVNLRDPDLIVERGALIHALAERAGAAGATLSLGQRVSAIAPHSQGVELSLERRGGGKTTLTAGALIGADGVFSLVGQAAGLPRPPIVQIIQAEVALPPGYDPRVTQVWFTTAETRYFYWLIPESDTHGVLGLIADDGDPARALLDHCLSQRGLRALAYQSAHVAMHHPSLRPWGQIGRAPVFLVGDAAGQVKVTTVGGSVTGFYGAAAAARCLVEGVSPQRALAGVRRELDLHWWIRRMLERLDDRGYATLIDQVGQGFGRFLARYNRDEMAGNIWRAPLMRPQLFGVGLAALMRPAAQAPELRPAHAPTRPVAHEISAD